MEHLRLAYFVLPLSPLQGNTSGPAKPVPRCFWYSTHHAFSWV